MNEYVTELCNCGLEHRLELDAFEGLQRAITLFRVDLF